jgi:hypothetical protein
MHLSISTARDCRACTEPAGAEHGQIHRLHLHSIGVALAAIGVALVGLIEWTGLVAGGLVFVVVDLNTLILIGTAPVMGRISLLDTHM